MEHFPSLARTNVKTAVPIPNSDRWITHEYKIRDANEVDVCLIIFSIKDGTILRRRFERVKRCYPRNTKTILGSYIEPNADLSYLRIHETDKISIVNTSTGEVFDAADLPAVNQMFDQFEKIRTDKQQKGNLYKKCKYKF